MTSKDQTTAKTADKARKQANDSIGFLRAAEKMHISVGDIPLTFFEDIGMAPEKMQSAKDMNRRFVHGMYERLDSFTTKFGNAAGAPGRFVGSLVGKMQGATASKDTAKARTKAEAPKAKAKTKAEALKAKAKAKAAAPKTKAKVKAAALKAKAKAKAAAPKAKAKVKAAAPKAKTKAKAAAPKAKAKAKAAATRAKATPIGAAKTAAAATTAGKAAVAGPGQATPSPNVQLRSVK